MATKLRRNCNMAVTLTAGNNTAYRPGKVFNNDAVSTRYKIWLPGAVMLTFQKSEYCTVLDVVI